MNRPTPAQDKIRAALPEIKEMIERGCFHKEIYQHLGVSNRAWDTAVKSGIIPRPKVKTLYGKLNKLRIKQGRIAPERLSDEALEALAEYAHSNGIDNIAEAMQEIALDALAEGRLDA